MRTPRASTARARPRTSLAGWIAAQCGVYVPPSTFVAPHRSRASSALSKVCIESVPNDRAGPLELDRTAGEHHRAALGVVAVDAFRRGDPADLVHCGHERPVQGDGRLATVPPGERGG